MFSIEINHPEKLQALDKAMEFSAEMARWYSEYSSKLNDTLQDSKEDKDRYEALCEKLSQDLSRDSVIFKCKEFEAYKGRVLDAEKIKKENEPPLSWQEYGKLFYEEMSASEFSPELVNIAAYYHQNIGSAQWIGLLKEKLSKAIPGKYIPILETNGVVTEVAFEGDKIVTSTALSIKLKDGGTGVSHDIFEGEAATLKIAILEKSDKTNHNNQKPKLLSFSSGPFINLIFFGSDKIVRDLWGILEKNIIMRQYISSLSDEKVRENLEKIREEKITQLKAFIAKDNNFDKILRGEIDLRTISVTSDFQSFINANLDDKHKLEYLENNQSKTNKVEGNPIEDLMEFIKHQKGDGVPHSHIQAFVDEKYRTQTEKIYFINKLIEDLKKEVMKPKNNANMGAFISYKEMLDKTYDRLQVQHLNSSIPVEKFLSACIQEQKKIYPKRSPKTEDASLSCVTGILNNSNKKTPEKIKMVYELVNKKKPNFFSCFTVKLQKKLLSLPAFLGHRSFITENIDKIQRYDQFKTKANEILRAHVFASLSYALIQALPDASEICAIAKEAIKLPTIEQNLKKNLETFITDYEGKRHMKTHNASNEKTPSLLFASQPRKVGTHLDTLKPRS